MADQALINLHVCEPIVLTTKEYAALVAEIECRHHLDTCTKVDKIFSRILLDNMKRYYDACDENKRRGLAP